MGFEAYFYGFNIDFIIKIFVAAVLGIILGWEREEEGKTAGIGTYSLITVGATMFTIASIHGFPLLGSAARDTARVAAQIVAGIGFIGAGIIWKHKNHIEGVTTAAGLWTTAAIGMLVGVNMVASAIAVTFVILAIFKFRKELGLKRLRNLKEIKESKK